jgi:hypothetical protein
MGSCAEGPVIVVYLEGVWYQRAQPSDLDSALLRMARQSSPSLRVLSCTHVRDAVDDSAGSAFDMQMCIEANMFDLAATIIAVDEAFAPNICDLRRKVRTDYKKWLTSVKNATSSIGKVFQISWMLDMIGLENDPSMAASRSFDPYFETISA